MKVSPSAMLLRKTKWSSKSGIAGNISEAEEAVHEPHKSVLQAANGLEATLLRDQPRMTDTGSTNVSSRLGGGSLVRGRFLWPPDDVDFAGLLSR